MCEYGWNGITVALQCSQSIRCTLWIVKNCSKLPNKRGSWKHCSLDDWKENKKKRKNWDEVKIDEKMKINSKSGTGKNEKKNQRVSSRNERKERKKKRWWITWNKRVHNEKFKKISLSIHRRMVGWLVPLAKSRNSSNSWWYDNNFGGSDERAQKITICLPLFSLCGKSICNGCIVWRCCLFFYDRISLNGFVI